MKTICIDARLLGSSGIGRFLENILQGFLKGAYNFKIIIKPDARAQFPWLESFDLVECSAPIYSIQEQIALPYLIPKCDLFWSPHFNIPLLPIRAKKRLVTIHDLFHLAFFKELSFLEKCYAKLVISQAISRSQMITTDSGFTVKEIAKFFPGKSDKMQVISIGVDLKKFSKMSSSFALPDKFFLFVGNLKMHKNLNKLLEAFKQVANRCDLVVVGKSFEKTRDQVVKNLKGVHFFENVGDDELSTFYAKAQGLVFPSLYEGFGLPPLEAMACSCPVIASNVASIPEVCGEAAYYIDPYDVDGMANAMKRFLDDKQMVAALKKKGGDRVLLFNWEKAQKRYLQLFEELLS